MQSSWFRWPVYVICLNKFMNVVLTLVRGDLLRWCFFSAINSIYYKIHYDSHEVLCSLSILNSIEYSGFSLSWLSGGEPNDIGWPILQLIFHPPPPTFNHPCWSSRIIRRIDSVVLFLHVKAPETFVVRTMQIWLSEFFNALSYKNVK